MSATPLTGIRQEGVAGRGCCLVFLAGGVTAAPITPSTPPPFFSCDSQPLASPPLLPLVCGRGGGEGEGGAVFGGIITSPRWKKIHSCKTLEKRDRKEQA